MMEFAGDGENQPLDTKRIDESFGHSDVTDPSAATPLLFLDAASFLADRRWWQAKQEVRLRQ